jgi:hypothetical protein
MMCSSTVLLNDEDAMCILCCIAAPVCRLSTCGETALESAGTLEWVALNVLCVTICTVGM